MKLFGFAFKKEVLPTKNPIPRPPADGETVISAGGFQGQYFSGLNETFTNLNESELILNYRMAAEHPECEGAIADITDAAIASGDKNLSLDLDETNLDPTTKQRIHDEFKEIISLLNFNSIGAEIFRKWYIDGKLYYQLVIDNTNTKKGIVEVIPIDPMRIRRIREVKKNNEGRADTVEEYYLYSESYIPGEGSGNYSNINGVKLPIDSVVFLSSGLTDPSRKKIYSHIQKALKPLNQLRMMEDALVIYRITRAPERRIFYVDVGNLPKGKAEEYIQGIMNKYRNKAVYDSSTGEIKDDRRHMSMLEDFWLPRRAGSGGTEITTLPGGQNLDQLEDVTYFQKKFLKSLNVPVSRLDTDSKFSFGKTDEITAEEVRFQRFVDRLRKKFSILFLDMLRAQLILKNIITVNDWEMLASRISVDFSRDNYFVELKETEILKSRIEALNSLGPNVGVYYSKNWVRKNVLRLNDEEIAKMAQEIAEESEEAPVSTDDSPIDPTLDNDPFGMDSAASSTTNDEVLPDDNTPNEVQLDNGEELAQDTTDTNPFGGNR